MNHKQVVKQAERFLLTFQTAKTYENTFARSFYQSMRLDRVELGEEGRYPGSVFFIVDSLPYSYRNAFDVAHGGALTTYVDIATTAAIFAFDKKQRTQVSAELGMSFMNPAVISKEHAVQIEAKVEKIGRNLSFTSA